MKSQGKKENHRADKETNWWFYLIMEYFFSINCIIICNDNNGRNRGTGVGIGVEGVGPVRQARHSATLLVCTSKIALQGLHLPYKCPLPQRKF